MPFYNTYNGHKVSATCQKCGSTRVRYQGGTITCANCGHEIYKPKRRNKYNASPTTARDGRKRDSKFEASVADELLMLKSAGTILDYDSQFKVELNIYDKQGAVAFTKTWKVDFRVHNNDGSFTLLEAKGLEGDDYKWKRDILTNVWLPEHLDYDFEVRKQRSTKKFSTGNK